MVSAIGSFSSSVSSTVAPTAALEAKIARDKKELSNCINCESAKTKQGQADIQALSNKISIAEARLKEIKDSNAGHQPAALGPPSTASNSTPGSNAVALIQESTSISNDEPASALNTFDLTKGGFVDVFV
jgi:hypothetical protein